ncbi:FecR domain-containing protein [Sphingobacterium psychroaquaticum]|uniref:FecR domain-containing protein n=1 Tax=Sphingobacterium psychroaquaticum TaxID=561061 RepID=UPI00141B86F0|nr:FecR domain-containing protein [Sphingobacterium psychroaquaticum]
MDFNQLYKKYLLNELSDAELQTFMDLLADVDEECVWELEEVLACSEGEELLSPEKTNLIYEQITGESLVSSRVSLWRRYKYLSVAAIFIAFLFSSLYFWRQQQENTYAPQQELLSIHNPTKFVKSIFLKDGTKVLLKQGSRLAVLSDFDSDTLRQVKLEGEAYFEVAKNQGKPFCIVESGAFDVRVLGTAFNFTNSTDQNKLVLNHGKVRVAHGEKQSLVHPGEEISYNAKTLDFDKHLVDTVASNLWTYSLLTFEKEPLIHIFDDLNSLYPEAKLQLKEAYKGEIFTGYLPANDLDKSLVILNKAFNITIISKR